MGMTLSMEEKVQTAAEAVIHAPAADETVTGRIVHAEDFDPLFAMSEEDCVEGFIKREMQRAGITEEQNLIPEDMLRRKNILNAVLAVLLFVYISLFFFHFPMKTYGDCTFPAGTYEALRVCIGKAKGRNWWCVLYPGLCFADSVNVIVPDEKKQELKNILTEEEYESLFDWREDDYQIRSGFLRLWRKLFA